MFGWFQNLGVKAKLLTAFTTVIVLTLVISAVSLYNLGSIKGAVSFTDSILSTKYTPNTELSSDINEVNDQMFTFVSNIREFTQDNRSAVDDKLNKIAQQVTALAQDNPSNLTASVKDDVLSAIDNYKNRLVPVLERNFQPMARGIYTVEIYPKMSNAKKSLVKVNVGILGEILNNLRSLNSNVPIVVVTFVSIAVVIISLFVIKFVAYLAMFSSLPKYSSLLLVVII